MASSLRDPVVASRPRLPTDDGRPHLHGAIASDGLRVDDVRKALRAAGKLRSDKPEPRAVVVKPITNGPGRSGYSTLLADRTRRELECKLLTATVSVLKNAREAYEGDCVAYLRDGKPQEGEPALGQVLVVKI
jgi:hypothetical protein